MTMRNLILLLMAIILWGSGCASHPPVFPQTPKEGETNMGFSFATENIIPVIWWRYGINRYTDVGYRLGIPLSGTGIDLNRILMKKDRRWDVLNIAYNIAPNSSFDITYYRFKGSERTDKQNPFNIGWTGFRCMIIPNGTYDKIEDPESIRFGFLFGRRLSYRWGFETGYFHDMKAGFDPNNSDYPHQHKKWPTQFSRGTGFSMQLFLYLGPTKKKKK